MAFRAIERWGVATMTRPGVPVFPRIERWPDDLDQFLALRTLELVGNPVVAKMLLGVERPLS